MGITSHQKDWFLVQPSRGLPVFKLFCFPHAGAGATTFHGWGDALPDGVELYALRLPGRELRHREPPITQMNALVDTLLHVLDLETGTYGFFGHSLGARIAFEITRALVHTGRPAPCQLWLSGSRAPHLARRRPLVHELSDDELLDELRGLYDAPREVLDDPELVRMYLPVIRGDLALHDSQPYRPAGALSIPISVFGGSGDPLVLRDDLEAWSIHTSAAFRVVTFTGGHLYLRGEARSSLLRQLAAELSSWIVRTGA